MIEITALNKSFGTTQALSDISLQFDEGKIYGLLGNNGAGKTTLLNIITDRYLADSGQVLLDGQPLHNNDAALSQLYMLGEKRYYPESMRVQEALRWSKEFYSDFDSDYAIELATRFQLPLKKKIIALSTGYGSIFKIIVALSVNTPYLLLDEPVLGLDAQHRDLFYRTLIEKYAANPCTIIISTHLIAEISNLIEHTIIIRNGRIIRDVARDEILQNGYTISGPAGLVDDYSKNHNILSASTLGGLKSVCLVGTPPQESLPAGLELGKIDLQEYFIQLMNEEETR